MASLPSHLKDENFQETDIDEQVDIDYYQG